MVSPGALRGLLPAVLVAGCAALDGAHGPAPPSVPAGDAAPPSPALPPPPGRRLLGEEYDAALGRLGLDRASARCSPRELALFAYGRFPTRLYEGIQADPAGLAGAAPVLRRGALAAAPAAAAAMGFAAARVDAGVRYGLLGDPLGDEVAAAARPGALREALLALAPAAPPPDPDAVPAAVQGAAALVLRAAARAGPWLERAFREMDPSGLRARAPADGTLLLAPDDEDAALRHLFEREAAALDGPYLARAAAEVLAAVDRAVTLLAGSAGGPPFHYRVATPAGEVLLRGGGDDGDAGEGPFLLVIDTGGRDRYGAGAASGPGTPVSVLIDLEGDDVYEGPPDGAAFGAGFFGVAALVDVAGDDRYLLAGPRSLGLGAGVFGAGLLQDRGGDDAYGGDAFCMGAGAAGFGVLADLSGDDAYAAFAYGQGFGFVRGSGLLVDVAGDDVYEADDREIRRPSPQTKEHNLSLCQGFGYGVRADYLDGHSLAGGVGMLVDGSGADRYSCGVFGQGGGYWMGVGMLLDGAGDDAYTGVWYVQGASAHFAVGLLEDVAGNDTFLATHNMAQGAGHDFSVGMLLDGAGDDRHSAPNLSLGAGNMNGVGVFADGGGDDVYEAKGTTLGLSRCREAGPEVPTLRHGALTLGVFLDLGGGGDLYRVHGDGAFAVDGGTWTQEEREPAGRFADERGVGVDR